MELVEELAFGVVQEYREQQKGRLKRTFVSGTDAAGAKVNRGKAKTSMVSQILLSTSIHSQKK